MVGIPQGVVHREAIPRVWYIGRLYQGVHRVYHGGYTQGVQGGYVPQGGV